MTTIRVIITLTFKEEAIKTVHSPFVIDRSISLPGVKGDPIRMIFRKGSSTSSGHYTSMISVNNIWYLCNDSNATVVDNHKFCISSTVYIVFKVFFFTKDKHSR